MEKVFHTCKKSFDKWLMKSYKTEYVSLHIEELMNGIHFDDAVEGNEKTA
jgi:hypothetical protein